MIKILGMYVEKTVGTYEDTDYETHNCVDTSYHIYVKNDESNDWKVDSKTVFDICLLKSIGPCGSGYCMSSFGSMSINQKGTGIILTHKYIGDATIDGNIKWVDGHYDIVHTEGYTYEDEDEHGVYYADETNDIFAFSSDGGDGYYPMGGIWINNDLFEEIPRSMSKRPVYVVSGESGIGKSTLGQILEKRLTVFETDSVDELPDKIAADVIILGNKSGYTIEDVACHIWKDDGEEINVIVLEGRRYEN